MRFVSFGLCLLGCTTSSMVKDTGVTETFDTSSDTGTEILTPFQRDLAPKLLACAGCHSSENPEAGLDLTDIRDSIGLQSTHLQMNLIEPGNHLQSYLWHKVAGTQSIAGGLGQQMPLANPWSNEDIELLAQWIDLGVPE